MAFIDWYLAPLLGYIVLIGETRRLVSRETNPARLAQLRRKATLFLVFMGIVSVVLSYAVWQGTK